MNIGEPQRIHEVEPIVIPVPEKIPFEPLAPELVPVGPNGDPDENE